MHDWWEFIQKDLMAIFAEFSSKDLQYPFAMILWIILVSFSLLGIDRRDHIAGMTYTLYCTTAAIVFFLALPGNYASINDIGVHIAFVSMFVGITSYRWFHRNDAFIVVSNEGAAKKKRQDAES